MKTTMTACLVALALGVLAHEARAEGTEPPVGVWSPPEARSRAAGGWSEPASDDVERQAGDDVERRAGDDVERHEDGDTEPPMRSGWGFGGGIALAAIGGSILAGAALASLPVGYEGNGGGDPGSEVAVAALLGAAATAGGIGLILWSRTPASGPSTAISVGPAAVRLEGSF